MKYMLKNISGGLLVCDFKDGNTLRLDNKQSVEVSSGNITPHIETLCKKGLIMRSIVEVEKIVSTKNTKVRNKKEE